MLVGSAAVTALAAGAADMPAFAATPLVCEDVVCFQAIMEMPNSAREPVLPPSLHPTVPAALSLQVYDVGASPWGAFRFAVARVSCRSGVRARGFSTGAVADSVEACAGLRGTLGYPAVAGEIDFRHGYDGVSTSVHVDGSTVCRIEALDPEPMGMDDVQFTGTLNLAHTPMGLRLVQLESTRQVTQAERVRARLLDFAGAGWGQPLLKPRQMVSAAVVVCSSWQFPPIRFVCKTDELAFTGTEAVR